MSLGSSLQPLIYTTELKIFFPSQVLLRDREVLDMFSSLTAAKTLDSSDRKLAQQNLKCDLMRGEAGIYLQNL